MSHLLLQVIFIGCIGSLAVSPNEAVAIDWQGHAHLSMEDVTSLLMTRVELNKRRHVMSTKIQAIQETSDTEHDISDISMWRVIESKTNDISEKEDEAMEQQLDDELRAVQESADLGFDDQLREYAKLSPKEAAFLQREIQDAQISAEDEISFAARDAENNMHCHHGLSGIDDDVLLQVRRKLIPAHGLGSASSKQLAELQNQRIYIAACLHESARILPQWSMELLRLLLSLKAADRNASFFVSIYESGSRDSTVQLLSMLEEDLNFIGVPNKIVHHGAMRSKCERIDFLADMRNRALEPLKANDKAYDRVLWLNDNMFCADGVLQMLAHALPEVRGGLGADAVCGMDYSTQLPINGRCEFYDKWVAHDIEGKNFKNVWPIVNRREDKVKLQQSLPFQVFSCWNSMVVFDAEVFQKEGLHFRSGRSELQECAAAESELIFHDMWNIGRGKIAVSPATASAYNALDFLQCAVEKQPTRFQEAPPVTWEDGPEQVDCCPLHTGRDVADFQSCFPQNWRSPSEGVPRGNLIGLDCESPVPIDELEKDLESY